MTTKPAKDAARIRVADLVRNFKRELELDLVCDAVKENAMRIQKIIWQHRRDFQAVYECEHCQATVTRDGYDDTNFHMNVIPKMVCDTCMELSDSTYQPRHTKYPDGLSV